MKKYLLWLSMVMVSTLYAPVDGLAQLGVLLYLALNGPGTTELGPRVTSSQAKGKQPLADCLNTHLRDSWFTQHNLVTSAAHLFASQRKISRVELLRQSQNLVISEFFKHDPSADPADSRIGVYRDTLYKAGLACHQGVVQQKSRRRSGLSGVSKNSSTGY